MFLFFHCYSYPLVTITPLLGPLKQNKYDDQICPSIIATTKKTKNKALLSLTPSPSLSLLSSPFLSFFSLHSSSITVIAVIVFVPRSTHAKTYLYPVQPPPPVTCVRKTLFRLQLITAVSAAEATKYSSR